jgi:hypothetical protein
LNIISAHLKPQPLSIIPIHVKVNVQAGSSSAFAARASSFRNSSFKFIHHLQIIHTTAKQMGGGGGIICDCPAITVHLVAIDLHEECLVRKIKIS